MFRAEDRRRNRELCLRLARGFQKQYATAEEFSIQEALLHVKESETDVEFDSDSLNPHYSYYDEHNHVHQVWMLDAVTAYNQLRASERLGVQARRYGGWDPRTLRSGRFGCRARRRRARQN